MICEKCHENPGEPFTFYYGKKAGESSTIYGNQRTMTTSYEIGKQKKVYLCKKCARRDISDWVKLLGLSVLFLGLVFLMIFTYYSLWNDGLIFIFGILELPVIAFLSTEIFNNKQDIGENKAIKFQRKKLEEQGYDKFLNLKEYKYLIKKSTNS